MTHTGTILSTQSNNTNPSIPIEGYDLVLLSDPTRDSDNMGLDGAIATLNDLNDSICGSSCFTILRPSADYLANHVGLLYETGGTADF